MDKVIKVCLTFSDQSKQFKNCNYDIKTQRFYLDDFYIAIKEQEPIIITPLLEAIDSKYYEMGYDIEVYCKGNSIKFSDIIGKENPYTEREVRLSHDWRKLVLNNEFAPTININF